MQELANNRKAYFDYEILEKFEAGMALLGHEVKSIKSGRMGLAGSYVVVRNGEANLLNSDIPPYQAKNTPKDYNPSRTRKLLLTNKEIRYLEGKQKESHLTLVPLKAYNKHGLIKLEFALAKGEKLFDKRETIKKRETERNIKRAMHGEY